MTQPEVTKLYDVVDATWPAARTWEDGVWTFREGMGGGSRVSAATASGPADATDVARAESEMVRIGQDRLFMIRQGQDDLDRLLETLGYTVKDPVNLYSMPNADLVDLGRPRHMTFRAWPPMAIQRELWAEAHIGPERLAVMDRAAGPKMTLLVRDVQTPAGNLFVGIHDRIAMIHALEIPAAHRRRGLARALIIAAARWAADEDAKTMSLVVTRANEAANQLYASMGFRLVGQYHYRIKKD